MTTMDRFDFLPEEFRDISPSRLVVVLYDEIIAALKQAIEAIADGDVARRFEAVKIATALIAELAFALDETLGGEVAKNLGSLYSFILRHLPLTNTKNDPKPAADALKLLMPLRDSWAELDRRIAAGEVPGMTATSAFGDAKQEQRLARAAA